MPELPEVETIVRDLRPRLTGRKLTNPRLHRPDVLRKVSRQRLLRTLDGNHVSAVDRRAKHLVVRLASGHRLVIQPRMTGSLVVYETRLTAEQRRYAVLEAGLGGGGRVVYRDVRRLGTIWLLDERGWQSYTLRIGPEPLATDFDADRFRHQMGGTRQAIKKALMDQRRLAGVGNIYANEALFRAQIDPSRPANRLARAELDRLYGHVRDVLEEAIAAQGTTVRDYRTGTGQSGSYQDLLQVYGRGGEPCRRCGARLVTTHEIDGRATTFCWHCQGMPR
ncbi:MAG: bifunctional DNA-formamidopyrimidine glycosylase/DNA-(apurinic or apyrimidinic site) lyase [Gemmatimonadota bacterium]|nr:MAG: bifunctional DNA-formamidopyrimidine glycosylase/DNA-(apurinic or apyrimidinic site) lyase [Gemmatimonadota bacterium]